MPNALMAADTENFEEDQGHGDISDGMEGFCDPQVP